MMPQHRTRAPRIAAWMLLIGWSASCTPLGQDVAVDDYIAAAARAGAPTTMVATVPATTSAPAPPAGPLAVTVQEAVLMALTHNRALAVQRLGPAIRQTYARQERAIFDPVISAEGSAGKARDKGPARTGGVTTTEADTYAGQVGAEVFLPTGTTIALAGATEILDSSMYSDQAATTRVGLSVTQALLRGAGVRVNLVRLRQARLDTLASEYELRAFAEALLAEVESAYWDYALAARQIEIYTQSLDLADKQLDEIVERVKVGKLAPTELAAAQAEVALRKEGLINARSALDTQRLRLLRLLNPSGRPLWGRQVALRNAPAAPEIKLDDVEQHVRVGLRMRADLNQARLGVRRGDLEVVKTRNGLLPKMDLFVTLGKSGYAQSFGRSVAEMDDSAFDALVGLRFEYPPANRDARARHSRAVLTRRQSAEALDNLAQLVQVDVRSAFIEVRRAGEQIAATAATRKLQAEKLRVETEKFRVGKSTSLLVGQAQRDLLTSQIAEIEAVVTHLKALVDLHRLEGSLLERRGVAAPGREPADPNGAP